jgi:SAM-dependent methyltransferase
MQAWEKIYREKGKFYVKPHWDLPKLVKWFKRRRVKKVLDLGCGSGRHVVYLAKQGFDVWGFDVSPEGIRVAEAWLAKEHLRAHLTVGDMTKRFPYKNNFFDAIISIQAMHHTTTGKVKGIIREIERVLREKGMIFITVPKRILRKKGDYFVPIPKAVFIGNKFKRLEERVYIKLEGLDRGLLHFYFNKKLIKKFFTNFDITDMHMDKLSHYCFVGIKKP